MTTAILGLDLGASSVRALIVAANGQVLGRGQASHPTLHLQPGFDEQRPDDWWQGVVNAVGNTRRFARQAEEMAIGITGQMHSVVLPGAARFAAHQHGLANILRGPNWDGVPLNAVSPNPNDLPLPQERLAIFREAVDCTLLPMHRLQHS